MQIHQYTQAKMIARMIGNLSDQLDLQRQRNCNLQQQLNLLSAEVIKHKKCILALLETNFETMTRLMNELKPVDNTDGKDYESGNEN